jgi:hypothetical protein
MLLSDEFSLREVGVVTEAGVFTEAGVLGGKINGWKAAQRQKPFGIKV